MKKIWAEQALTLTPDGTPDGSPDGTSAGVAKWQDNVVVEIDDSGHITSVRANVTKPDASAHHCGALLPAPANVHSHSFQRAMAGMTERRGVEREDNFWAWRKLMYRFLDQLTPDDIEAITAFVQMQMLEAGYGAHVEFHYLHHQKDGTPYADIAELSNAVARASLTTGMGLTLLPVLYQQGGCDGRALGAGQIRFGNDIDRFAELLVGAERALKHLPEDSRLGVAPHSLRAVSRDALAEVLTLRPKDVVHMHVAEQVGEVKEVTAAYGARPVEWLFGNHAVDARWCMIHLTQMLPHETSLVAGSGAVAGLCPITEANLGDGIFDAVAYFKQGGRFGIGSDSNVRIALAEELRGLEYSQRLTHRARAVLATPDISNGGLLFRGAAEGGAQAAGRRSGAIEVGRLADLCALDSGHVDLLGRRGDMVLDSFIFAGDKAMISDVWSAGRHVVQGGQHIKHAQIVAEYKACVQSLKARL